MGLGRVGIESFPSSFTVFLLSSCYVSFFICSSGCLSGYSWDCRLFRKRWRNRGFLCLWLGSIWYEMFRSMYARPSLLVSIDSIKSSSVTGRWRWSILELWLRFMPLFVSIDSIKLSKSSSITAPLKVKYLRALTEVFAFVIPKKI